MLFSFLMLLLNYSVTFLSYKTSAFVFTMSFSKHLFSKFPHLLFHSLHYHTELFFSFCNTHVSQGSTVDQKLIKNQFMVLVDMHFLIRKQRQLIKDIYFVCQGIHSSLSLMSNSWVTCSRHLASPLTFSSLHPLLAEQ